MKLTERLKIEHGVFLLQLQYLEELVRQHAPPAALAAVVGAIVTAEAHHAAIEDRLLYPALRERLGKKLPVLEDIEADHHRIGELAEQIRSGSFDEGTVSSFVTLLRAHVEKEIHETFARIEQVIPAEQLASMCNWNEEHVYGASGNRELWLDSLGSPPRK
jgi:hemerythrin-like domain-containing protein